MKTLFRHKWIKITAAALSLSLIGAALALVLTGADAPLRGLGEGALRPFLRLWAEGSQQVKDWETALFEGEALLEENRELKEENGVLRRRLHSATLTTMENTRLRTLLGARPESWQGRYLPAWILPGAGDSLTAEVTLDRGTADGVRAGLCVTDCAGNLLGLVRSAGENCCTVSLLWDRQFRLTGQGISSETMGILEGSESLLAERRLKLTGLTEEEMVQIGETVVTFGGSSLVPKGLTVGTVTGIREDPGGLTRWAVIAPATEQTTGEVFVVLTGRDSS